MEDKEKTKTKCKCPFCEHELEMKCFEPVFCEPCGTKYTVCERCNQVYKAELKSCPKCGGGK
ncbi:MAG: hypothetical protein A2252_09770 [Elusimicrobia bacterium RIFOXYA2_FULL_39_19]|nr:MAG: hypothetical protein A2252_09770 [Elusimicrobia bacterium RIFOXYA2_FULL_39_19]